MSHDMGRCTRVASDEFSGIVSRPCNAKTEASLSARRYSISHESVGDLCYLCSSMMMGAVPECHIRTEITPFAVRGMHRERVRLLRAWAARKPCKIHDTANGKRCPGLDMTMLTGLRTADSWLECS